MVPHNLCIYTFRFKIELLHLGYILMTLGFTHIQEAWDWTFAFRIYSDDNGLSTHSGSLGCPGKKRQIREGRHGERVRYVTLKKKKKKRGKERGRTPFFLWSGREKERKKEGRSSELYWDPAEQQRFRQAVASANCRKRPQAVRKKKERAACDRLRRFLRRLPCHARAAKEKIWRKWRSPPPKVSYIIYISSNQSK